MIWMLSTSPTKTIVFVLIITVWAIRICSLALQTAAVLVKIRCWKYPLEVLTHHLIRKNLILAIHLNLRYNQMVRALD
jgi:hypothetical protein